MSAPSRNVGLRCCVSEFIAESEFMLYDCGSCGVEQGVQWVSGLRVTDRCGNCGTRSLFLRLPRGVAVRRCSVQDLPG